MNKKLTFAVIIVALVVLGGLWLLRQPTPQAPIVKSTTPTAVQQPAVQQPSSAHVVAYTAAGYAPQRITIKVGETVTWKNQSTKAMWTASGLHPSHLVYPTTGGCIGSTFDTCAGIQTGDSWSFRFDLIGSWNYHNHLYPSDFGMVIVEK